MTTEKPENNIDPFFAVSVFLIAVVIITATWNSMMGGEPLKEVLFAVPVPPLIVCIFLLALGVGRQIQRLKQRRQRHT